ncbi:MAG TPA: PilC/PilY family type IV pilus protein [Rhodanobacter sp.]|jgi:type IV pilus assembly protein PilY1|nr:PilC/PilY family type IV pilus protein [Rhodanobacter sp.]
MSKPAPSPVRSLSSAIGTAAAVLLIGWANLQAGVALAGPVTQPISQVPLTTVVAKHPQILLAIGNSESMDGTLSGAIMVGSGSLDSNLSSLSTSSSPTNYAIPSGFTPPVTPTAVGVAPYTVSSRGTLYDNGPSRLNVAKGGLTAILDQYMQSADFALMDYQASGITSYQTWVYYMSPAGGFTFTNTAPAAGNPYVNNPCLGYTLASSTVKSNCNSLDSTLFSGSISTDAYMLVGASSDDPDVNDVLYASGFPGIFVSYNGPSPANPYSAYTLAQYNSNLGNILSSYSSTSPNVGAWGTYPTNAGYIPFSPQVMYARRGFGYGASTSSSTGTTLVGMTSAIVPPATAPNSATIASAIAKFTPYLAPETSDSSTREIKSVGGQSALPALLAGAAVELAKDVPPTTGSSCVTHQYVVLITDGLPTQDLAGHAWPPLGSASAQASPNGFGVNAVYNADGTLNTSSASTNDQAMIDTIAKITALQQAGVETYVIGLGAGVDPTQNPAAANALHAMALAGATGSDYLPATSPTALVNALGQVMSQVLAKNISTSSAAANSTTLSTGSQVYQATFSSADWSGDLSAYAIDPTTALISSTATWSAQTQLDSNGWGTRHIATWDPYASTPKGVPFQWPELSTTLQTQLAAAPTDPADTGPNRVDYLRGSNALEKTGSNPTGIYRSRLHLLGDVVDSAPDYVGVPSGSYTYASYDNFVATYSSRTPMIYFGGNDGMLHGVNASTGVETLAFIPNGVFSNLPRLTNPLYNQNHRFFVDGSPKTEDVLLADGKWHTLLVGGENAGGKSIYALDITDPTTFTSDAGVASAVKWEFTDSDMGLSFSTPTIVQSSAVSVTDAVTGNTANGFAVLFGNGYNSTTGDAIFYAVNASTGALLRKIDLCTVVATACDATTPNGLSSIAAANSSGVVGVPEDMAYAGDLQGNFWAIDMSNSNPSLWTARLLFQARDGSGNAQPITTAPALTPNPNFPSSLGLMAFFGTGQLLTQSDLIDTHTQSFYGVWDNNLDLSSYAAPAPAPPYKRANLQSQTITIDTSGSIPVVQSSNNAVNLTYATETVTNPSPPPASLIVAPVEGWYFDLTALDSTQESARSVTTPQVESGGVVFTTNALSSSACAVGGASYLMNVKYDSGGPFSEPAIGLGGGINIGNGAVSGQNPTGVFVNNGYSSAPTTVKSGAGTNVQIISTANGLQVVPTLGDKPSRVGWWQVQ